MKFLLTSLLVLLAFPDLRAQPDTIHPGRDLTPLLPYIFFDSGSAVIPDRYVRFKSSIEVEQFADTTIEGDALAHYRQTLNIIGYRLKKYPRTTIAVSGHDSQQPDIGETKPIAEQRAQTLRNYLVEIWGIDPSRIRILPSGGWPKFPSNKKDPLGIVENRRAEISTDDWEIIQPIWRSRQSTGGGSPIDLYTFILFKFDSPDAGQLNERVLREYLDREISQGARVTVVGSVDIIDDRCIKLSSQRAASVVNWIRKNIGPGRIASLQGMGASEAQYVIDLPEGRFFSRSVLVSVER